MARALLRPLDAGAENAEAPVFLEALLYRRYTAKLQFELAFWSGFPDDAARGDDYSKRLTAATGIRYRPTLPLRHGRRLLLGRLPAGLDPLVAAPHHLVREIGDDWWRNPKTGDHLRELWREGTKPSSEEIAARMGFAPLDTGPLVAELGG